MNIEDVKGLPFATYDLLVYLTTGFIALFFIVFIAFPFLGVDTAISHVSKQESFIYSAITLICFLLASYVIGHFLAFTSGYIIERLAHSLLGYPADLYIKLAEASDENQKKVFVDSIKSFNFGLIQNLILLINLPAIPGYAALYLIGAYGFYYPRVPKQSLATLQARVKELDLGVECQIGTRWIKLVEHYVANHCPVAYTRLYNYLVVYGLLRSVSLMSLAGLWVFMWLEFVGDINFRYSGQSWTLSFHPSIWYVLLAYAGLSSAHILNVMAFCKFNRRFFEECVLAFLLSPGKIKRPASIKLLT